jgi:hypothetical protein
MTTPGDSGLLSVIDKMYWARIALGVVAGVLASGIFTPFKVDTTASIASADFVDGALLGVLVYLGSFYLFRFKWGKVVGKEKVGKLYTTGVGAYVMIFLFFWILLFTLGFRLI